MFCCCGNRAPPDSSQKNLESGQSSQSNKDQKKGSKSNKSKGDGQSGSPRANVTKDDFETIKILGKGAFGEVELTRRKVDGKLFATKIMQKKNLSQQQIPRLLAERNVMAFADHNWVVMLDYAFQDETKLYLVMDFLQGGDLMGLLMEQDTFTIDATKFYIGEISMAVHSIHEIGYCHRDLKPDNILLTKTGHIKLADFGLAKKLSTTPLKKKHEKDIHKHEFKGNNLVPPEQTLTGGWKDQKKLLAHSMVGTPDYMAPEIFTHDGYDEKCDWWGVGCIMFECLAGYAPFYSNKNLEHTVHSIINWSQRLVYHDVKDQEAVKFLKTVLTDVETRSTFVKIRKHPFFASINFDNLSSMKAPYHSEELENEMDTRYFYYDKDDYDQEEEEEAVGNKVIPKENQVKNLEHFAFNVDFYHE